MQEIQEMWVQSWVSKVPLEEEMATHSNILAWKIPWTEEPGGLYSPRGRKESDMTEHAHKGREDGVWRGSILTAWLGKFCPRTEVKKHLEEWSSWQRKQCMQRPWGGRVFGVCVQGIAECRRPAGRESQGSIVGNEIGKVASFSFSIWKLYLCVSQDLRGAHREGSSGCALLYE